MDKEHYTTLMEALAQVPDPRHKRGVRHSWRLILGLIAAAMSSGQNHGRTIAQWVREHSESLTESLEPPNGRLPSESTLRRALRDLDVETLEQRSKQYTQGLGKEQQAAKPLLERYWRGHWSIKNRSHYVRDVTMGEDAGQAYTGSTPEAMAALRNCIIGLLRHNGWKTIADALRLYGAYPDRALSLIGAIPARL